MVHMGRRPSLHLLLADSELEIVPREHWSHPAVVSNARKRGKRPSTVLLDSSIHRPVFKDPNERERRGRPDIVHQFLLLGLDSILNIERRLHLYVHTRNDEFIDVDPALRLPRNYSRYSGILEELFKSKCIPSPKKPLLSLREGVDYGTAVGMIEERLSGKGISLFPIILDPSGERVETHTFFSRLSARDGEASGEDILCTIGGFPHGDYSSDVCSSAGKKISISDELLTIWAVEIELLVGFRQGT